MATASRLDMCCHHSDERITPLASVISLPHVLRRGCPSTTQCASLICMSKMPPSGASSLRAYLLPAAASCVRELRPSLNPGKTMTKKTHVLGGRG